jgi:chromosome segregation ATPase
MSDTPETDASVFDAEANGIIYKVVFAAFASQLERERNSLRDQRDFCMGEIERLKQERDEARMQYQTTHLLAEVLAKTQVELKKERDEQTAQMCQAIGHLSDIAQTCQEWLDSIIQEPAVDFIKAIRDWAKRKVEGK